MVSRKLMGVWAVLDICLLAAAAFALGMSIKWRAPDLLLNLVVTNGDLTAGTALAVALLVTFVVSIGAIVQANHVTIGLKLLNWLLILDSIAVVIIGTFVWWATLQERATYHEIFAGLTPAVRTQIQDTLKCCGYFNSTDLAEVGGSFCVSEEFVLVTNNATGKFCVGPMTEFADNTLNNIFTTVYGFMAVIVCLFLTTVCVINKRMEDERFKKIDAKRGGRGFV